MRPAGHILHISPALDLQKVPVMSDVPHSLRCFHLNCAGGREDLPGCGGVSAWPRFLGFDKRALVWRRLRKPGLQLNAAFAQK